MGWQERLRNVARNLAGATGEALTDFAEDSELPFLKADAPAQPMMGDDDQDDAPGGMHPDTAESNPVPDESAAIDPKTLFWDPFAIIEQLGYKERPTAISYGTLKSMVYKTPIVHAIIQTRIQQMASFCQPSRDRYEMGFRVKVRDSHKEPTPAERKWIQQAETLVLRTGVTDNPRGRDTFEKFVRKVMWDSMVYDQMAFEIVPNMRGEPAEWYAVDASTIRLADTASTYLNEDNPQAVRYVQIYDGMIISEYSQEELAFGVRNPRTDIRLFGYGVAELEMLMNVITALLFAWEYNQKNFSQGSSQKGILNFKGAIPERQLKAFRRHWYQMISGVENCIAGDSVLWTPTGAATIADIVGEKQERETVIWTGTQWCPALAYKTKQPKTISRTTLGNGVTVATSPDHKFRVIGSDGEPCWKVQSDLEIGDFVFVNKEPVATNGKELPAYKGQLITPALLEVLGWLTGDGYLKENAIQLFYGQGEQDIRQAHAQVLSSFEPATQLKEKHLTSEEREAICERYGFQTTVDVQYRIDVFSKEFVTWLMGLGFHISAKSQGGKVIPGFVSSLPTPHKAAFLRGLFSADGNNAKGRSPAVTIANHNLREQTKLLLLSLGIRTSLSEGKTKAVVRGRERDRVEAASVLRIKDRDRFFALVGFLQDHKQPVEMLKDNERNKCSRVAHSTVLKYLRLVRSANDALGKGLLTRQQRMDLNSILVGQDGCSLPRLLRFMEFGKLEIPTWLQTFQFEPVVDIERTNELVPMYDLQVYNDEHQFANCGVMQHNSWRTPITNAEDLQWISMQNSNRDMEFNAFFDFLIKISCAIFTIDPTEINFKYGNTGQRGGLQEANNKEKVTESKERGLRPLLRFLEGQINHHIIWPINENFEFKFVGLDAKTRDEIADLNTKLVKTIRTVDELRAEDNLPPLPDGKGEVILDPTWLQFSSAKDQAAQGGGMPGGGGPDPNAPGGDAAPGADGQGDSVDFQQLLAQQEADDQDTADDQDAEEEEDMAQSLRPSLKRPLRVDLRL
jgi:intein/homing endonuclease